MQCDLWRTLRLPGILVGDSALGGISTTIAALDCLRQRGYDVPALILTDNLLQNWKYLQQHLGPDALVACLPACHPPPEGRY
jgi:dethiobiotin synthetase/adenosylmethionine--8-amino-7-oxononanoate aminotransferase